MTKYKIAVIPGDGIGGRSGKDPRARGGGKKIVVAVADGGQEQQDAFHGSAIVR